MIEYSEEKLSIISKYAAAFMAPAEIAIVLDMDIKLFNSDLKNERSPAFKAYHKAKIEKKYLIREKAIKMAEYGSSSAGSIVEDLIIDQAKKERDGGY